MMWIGSSLTKNIVELKYIWKKYIIRPTKAPNSKINW